MYLRMLGLVVLVVAGSVVVAGENTTSVRFTLALPVAVQHVVVVPAGEMVSAKSARTVELAKAIELSTNTVSDVWVMPKVGLPVRALAKFKPAVPKEPLGKPAMVTLDDELALLRIVRTDLPRPSKVVLAPVFDRGPDEPGHKAVQTVPDYSTPLLAPPGQYSLWVVPANGARPQRVEDNLRLLAGRSTTLD